ncbi:MAG: PDZ domain-containing protein [Planctomycetes bacterium]|jgi:hypothetical protein|nr:PDZ domain-containing protein [Planctomycetota bacterium]
MRILGSLRPALLLLFLGVPAAGEPERLVLSGVNLGEQVSGPTLSPEDLEGKVVLIYHWCVSCPISTGAFPFVNGLVERYGDRGLAVVGFQVRRNPEVDRNDIVWYLEHLGPAFPVVHHGWTCEWPQAWLPWAVLFDHEGNEVVRGGLAEIEPIIVKALEEAPDVLLGGPYHRLADAAARIAADRAHAGGYLPEIRRIAGESGAAEDERAEARALLDHVAGWFEGQMRKAQRDADGPVERARIYLDLSRMFDGDDFGKRASEALAETRSAPRFAAEEEAFDALAKARAAFRRLPPPGRYIYHPTEMIYETLSDRPLLDRRARMHAVFREELERIRRVYPETYAAEVAGDLLFEHDPPEMDETAAAERLARAERLIAEGGRPEGLAEGALLLREAAEGRPEGDATAARASALLAALGRERGAELATARAALAALEEGIAALEAEVRAGGSLLPRERAEDCLRRLGEIARRAGAESELSRRAAAYAAALRQSYEGPAQLGVVFDGSFPGPGLRIAQVHAGTGAAAAGLRPGDVLLGIDGERIESAEGLRALLSKRRPGDRVELRVERPGDPGASGESLVIHAVLGRRT